MSGIFVIDGALDAAAHRAVALSMTYGDGVAGAAVFHGIAACPDEQVAEVLRSHFPGVEPTSSLFRRSPFGQVEPHLIHCNSDVGEWTAIVYLNPMPPPEDGTLFWRHLPTGRTRGPWDPEAARDLSQWREWIRVGAMFGRIVAFPADLYHSRGMPMNFGIGDDARLVHVLFGVGPLRLTEDTATMMIAVPHEADDILH